MGKTRRQNTSNERNERETIQKLKAIIRSQRKQISRLNRELHRRDDVTEQYKELLDETMPAPKVRPTEVCPKCGQDVEEVPIGKFTLQRCTDCEWRTRKK